MRKRRLLLLGALLASSAFSQVVPAVDDIVLDGKLDEASWAQAPIQTNFLPPISGAIKTVRAATSFRMVHKDNVLYIGVKCDEPQMDKLSAPSAGAIWSLDALEFFFSPNGLVDQYYQFVVTPGNIQWCQYYGEGGTIKPDPFAPAWETRAFLGADFWSVEVALPLSAFYMTRNREWKSTWRVNVFRNRFAAPPREESGWGQINFSNNEVSRYKTLSGFPMRQKEADLWVKSAKVKQLVPDGGSYLANVQVEVQAEPGAIGKRTLELAIDRKRVAGIPVELKEGVNSFHVTGLHIPTTGNQKLFITLKNDKLTMERSYPLSVEYAPLKFQLTSPAYCACVFPDQKCTKIAGNLLVSAGGADAQVTLTLSGPGLAASTRVIQAPKASNEFAFTTPVLPFGTYQLKAELTSGGKTTATLQQPIRVLPPTGKDYYYVDNGSIFKNGKAYFHRSPCALMYMTSQAFRERFLADELYLTPHVMCPLEPFRLVGRAVEPETTKDQPHSQKVMDAMRKAIEQTMADKDKSIQFYYLSDEPECRNISPVYLKYMYDVIKEMDPYRPVWISTRTPAAYLECADIFSTHPYFAPVNDNGRRMLGRPIADTRDAVNEISLLNRPDKTIGLVAQFFSYGNLTNRQGDYPTFHEMDCSIWSSIINGGRFLWPYAYHDLGDRPHVYECLRYTFGSMAELEDILLKSKVTHFVSSERLLEGAMFQYRDQTLVAVANLGEKPLKGTLTSPVAWPTIPGYRIPGELKAGKAISGTFSPYEVRVYCSQPSKLPSRADMLKKIEQLEKERLSRDNVLLGKGHEIEVDSSYHGDFRNQLWEQNKMFDGTLDMLAWKHWNRATQPWYELNFPSFVPTFSKIRLHGYALENTTVKIWKAGEWKTIDAPQVQIGKYCWEWKLDKTWRTVKLRFEFQKIKGDNFVELTEIELAK